MSQQMTHVDRIAFFLFRGGGLSLFERRGFGAIRHSKVALLFITILTEVLTDARMMQKIQSETLNPKPRAQNPETRA